MEPEYPNALELKSRMGRVCRILKTPTAQPLLICHYIQLKIYATTEVWAEYAELWLIAIAIKQSTSITQS
jgi:hypothetical protein